MPFPSDWSSRWWLRKGEVAAIIELPDRLPIDVIFAGDDTKSLWQFDIEGLGKPILWDHAAGHFALSPTDAALGAALSELMSKLTGNREAWTILREERAILDVLARGVGQGLFVTGRRLRHAMHKGHAQDPDAVAYYLERLGRRYVERFDLGDGENYRLTLPGLLASSEASRAKAVILSVLTVLSVEYDKDPDVDAFTMSQIERVGELAADDETRAFARNAVTLLVSVRGREPATAGHRRADVGRASGGSALAGRVRAV